MNKRVLQMTVGVLCLVPIGTGLAGMLGGPPVHDLRPVDLDSHYRYLSGLLFAIGLVFATTIPRIEQKGPQFRLLGCLVIVGGAGRLLGLLVDGVPSLPHCIGLGLELGVMPLLMLWQDRLAPVDCAKIGERHENLDSVHLHHHRLDRGVSPETEP
jgi:hypothetical protein